MSKRIRYTDEPIEAEVVRDFLPSPDQLASGEEGVKITLSLSRRSVEFFKLEAARNHTSYQRMIRRLLDAYADRYQREAKPRAGRKPGSRTSSRRLG